MHDRTAVIGGSDENGSAIFIIYSRPNGGHGSYHGKGNHIHISTALFWCHNNPNMKALKMFYSKGPTAERIHFPPS
jgi:hypothetical protein